MNKIIFSVLAAGMMATGTAAVALPQMDYTQAKATLTGRQNTATGQEFIRRRVREALAERDGRARTH